MPSRQGAAPSRLPRRSLRAACRSLTAVIHGRKRRLGPDDGTAAKGAAKGDSSRKSAAVRRFYSLCEQLSLIARSHYWYSARSKIFRSFLFIDHFRSIGSFSRQKKDSFWSRRQAHEIFGKHCRKVTKENTNSDEQNRHMRR